MGPESVQVGIHCKDCSRLPICESVNLDLEDPTAHLADAKIYMLPKGTFLVAGVCTVENINVGFDYVTLTPRLSNLLDPLHNIPVIDVLSVGSQAIIQE